MGGSGCEEALAKTTCGGWASPSKPTIRPTASCPRRPFAATWARPSCWTTGQAAARTTRFARRTPIGLPAPAADGRRSARRSLDSSLPVTDSPNATARETSLPWMKCPVDGYNGEENRYRAIPQEGPQSTFSRGDYGINGGVSDLVLAPGLPWLRRLTG